MLSLTLCLRAVIQVSEQLTARPRDQPDDGRRTKVHAELYILRCGGINDKGRVSIRAARIRGVRKAGVITPVVPHD